MIWKKIAVFGVMLAFSASAATAGIIDPFGVTDPLPGQAAATTSAAATLTNGVGRILKTGGGVTSILAGTSTLRYAADSGASRTASLTYKLPAAASLVGQNFGFGYSTALLGATPLSGAYSVTVAILSAFNPNAAVLASAVQSVALAGSGTVAIPGASLVPGGMLGSVQYLKVTVTRTASSGGGTFSFTSPFATLVNTPEPASLVLFGLTGLGAFVVRRRRASRTVSA